MIETSDLSQDVRSQIGLSSRSSRSYPIYKKSYVVACGKHRGFSPGAASVSHSQYSFFQFHSQSATVNTDFFNFFFHFSDFSLDLFVGCYKVIVRTLISILFLGPPQLHSFIHLCVPAFLEYRFFFGGEGALGLSQIA